MRAVLLNPPVPGRRLTNRDLMGGMGIDDGFGLGLGQRFIAHLKNEGTRMPVLALAYGAAILSKHHEVTVLDLAASAPDDPGVLEAVCAAQPDWVVAATSFAFLGAELRFLERVRERTGAQRMLLGYTATHFGEEILARGLAEAVASGDPEVALRHLAAERVRAGLPGLMVRADDGTAVPSPAGYLDDLDSLPAPRWDGFPLSSYRYFPLLRATPFVTALSSRGCPYQCHFCPYPVAQGAPFRARSAARVVDELAQVAARHGVRSVLFRDPTFTLDMNRARAIAEALLERGLSLEFGIETRLDRMDEPMIELLARAGCRSVEFGVDPLEEHSRAASHRKGIRPERAAALVRAMGRAGIASAGLFVIGTPEQDANELQRTLDWIESLEVSYMNYEIATPFPGTELYARAVSKGWTQPISLDDLMHGDPKLSFNGVIDLARMKALQDEALARFYLRPRRLIDELRRGDVLDSARFFARSGASFLRRWTA